MAAASREARLTLRLIDAVSGPSRAAAAALRGLNQAMGGLGAAPARAIGRSARQLRAAAGELAPAGAALGLGIMSAGRTAYRSEVELNKAQAAGNLTLEERLKAEANAIALNYKYGGSVNDIIAAHTELLRSGLDLDASLVALPNVLNLAQATGENTIDVARAITTNLTALRLEMDQSARAADLFVQALDRTAGINLSDLETSGKYWNPAASMTGLTPEEAMALQIEFAKRGIYGSSAGTGLRAGPAAILSPTTKALGALGQIGLAPEDYIGQRTGEASAAQILGTLEARGIEVTEEMEAGFAQIIAQYKTDADRSQAIIAAFGEQLGLVTGEDRAAAYEAVFAAFSAGAAEVDLPRLLKDARERGAGIPFFNAVFGKYHGTKWAGFDPASYAEELAEIERNALGSADRKSATMMQGIVGDVNDFEGALQNLINTLKHSGAMGDASRAMGAMARAADQLSDANPALLRFGIAAAVGLALAAPLGFAISGIGAAAAIALNPITLVGGALAGLVALNWAPLKNGLRTLTNHLEAAINPAVVARMQESATAAKDWIASFTLPNLGLNRLAADLGTGLANGVNAAHRALPKLRELAGEGLTKLTAIREGIAAFARGAWVDLLPRITPGIESLKQAFSDFIVPKTEGFAELASAIVDFGARAMPHLTPTMASAINLVAESFNTMASGAGAIARVIGGAAEGIYAFNQALFGGVDVKTMQSTANGLASVFDTMLVPLRPLQSLFNAINVDFTDFAATAGGKLGEGLNAITAAIASVNLEPVISLFNRIARAIRGFVDTFPTLDPTAALSTMKAAFDGVASYVPDFSKIINAVSGMANAIASAIRGIVGAVNEAIGALQRLGNTPVGVGSAAGAVSAVAGGPGISSGDRPLTGGAMIGSMIQSPPEKAGGAPSEKARGFVKGGSVSGPGTGTSDSIRAWLSNGEFVVNAKAAAMNSGILNAINSGFNIVSGPGPMAALDFLGTHEVGEEMIFASRASA